MKLQRKHIGGKLTMVIPFNHNYYNYNTLGKYFFLKHNEYILMITPRMNVPD